MKRIIIIRVKTARRTQKDSQRKQQIQTDYSL